MALIDYSSVVLLATSEVGKALIAVVAIAAVSIAVLVGFGLFIKLGTQIGERDHDGFKDHY